MTIIIWDLFKIKYENIQMNIVYECNPVFFLVLASMVKENKTTKQVAVR